MDPEIKDLGGGPTSSSRARPSRRSGRDLSAAARDGQAVTIEMGGMILIPGLVDGHRHCLAKTSSAA